jgi:dolichol-phosphate mannosyltransferase
MTDPYLSIILPLYNEEENIEALYQALMEVLTRINKPYEVILVDDGSRDKSFEMVKQLHAINPAFNGISLSRNFGHQIALSAGLQHARGEVIVTMDADLQHPPATIPTLLEQFNQGFDIVNTRRIDSKEIGTFKKLSSHMFYRMINTISDVPIMESSSDFRLMSRRALDAFLQFNERDRFTRGLISWMGFRQALVDYQCPPRFAGKSKYTLRKMIHFATDGITAFSSRPLRIASYLGLLVFLAGIIYSISAVVQFFRGTTVPGWTSMLVTVLLLGGIQLLSLGIIGEYMARIYNESKSRPLYFVKDKTA